MGSFLVGWIFWLLLFLFLAPSMEDKPALRMIDIHVFYSMPSVSKVLNAVISQPVRGLYLDM
jgi:hypothetical protein